MNHNNNNNNNNKNITSTNLIRITERDNIHVGEYYLLKYRVNGKPRKDYIAYLVSQPNAISMVFKFIWFRTTRSSEVKPYNEWISVSRLRKDIHNFIIIVRPQEFNSNQVLIYSLGRLGEIISENKKVNPKFILQEVDPNFILQKSNVNEEIKTHDDSNGNSRTPSLQYLSSMALPHNDMMLIKDNTILEPNRIPKYLPEQNQNAGKISKRQRRRYKSKHRRKYKKTRKHRKTKILTRK
jgi:hypothetical protein